MKVNCSKKGIDKCIKVAYKEYEKLKKESQKHREYYLEKLVATLEKADKGKKATIVKQLISAEAQRALFQRFAFIHRKNESKFINKTHLSKN